MEVSRPRDIGDIANLELTLREAKQILVHGQQAVALRKLRSMRSRGRTVRPVAVDVTSMTGGSIRSRRRSAWWRSGYRGVAASAVGIARVVPVGRRIAGPHRSWTSCARIFPPCCHIVPPLAC